MQANTSADGRSRSGKARMEKLTAEERKQLARDAALERWRRARARQVAKDTGTILPGETQPPMEAINEVLPSIPSNLPVAKWPGELDGGLQCYVLSDSTRIISRTGATTYLTDGKGGGNLESFVGVQSLRKYMPEDLTGAMVEFVLPEVVNKTVKGIEAEKFVEICQAYVDAWRAGEATESQTLIAMRAAAFLAACAKVGITALIDEATGYQYERPSDALQIKLKLFLAEEMRKWEKTFPDDLWVQFGRLTNWKGQLHSRPKVWGKYVTELIYEYLDPDVAEWLKANVPHPMKGQNYHSWLSAQYGLKRLVEHIWKVIGVASTCETMPELRKKMQELYGKAPGFQFELKLIPGPTR